jgi:Zn-dependent protease with chaperone function
MNMRSVMLSGLLITSHFMGFAGNHGVYYAELEAYKQSPEAKQMFDEDAHLVLATIQRDIAIYKNLTSFQRFVRSAFLGLDVVIVTPDTLPTLYGYVDGICKKAEIVTPTVFVTRHDGFFNAAAQKLLMSSGAIVIGQKLIHDLSDDAIEAIVAHELGHIKHNHVNKIIALQFVDWAVYFALIKLLSENGKISGPKSYFAWIASSLVSPAIINKRFEKEADAFACDNGKSKGIVEFFELILKKEELREEEFVAIYQLLQENKANLTFSDYYFDLIIRYYMAKGGHNIGKAFKYVYHNTILGAHPSPEVRIAAAQQYLASQEA